MAKPAAQMNIQLSICKASLHPRSNERRFEIALTLRPAEESERAEAFRMLCRRVRKLARPAWLSRYQISRQGRPSGTYICDKLSKITTADRLVISCA